MRAEAPSRAAAATYSVLRPCRFRYDGLSGVFLVAFGFSAAAASLSVIGERARSRAEGVAWPLFLASIVLVLGASDAFSFLLAWESMALLSALLVVGLRPTRAIVSAGNLYLALTHTATVAILVSFGLFAASSGGALSFEAWKAAAAGGGLAGIGRDVALGLAFVGFATKAGAIPFHSWLPRAHPVAPSHVSAVMSGVMIKTGIYGLIRIAVDVAGGTPDWLGLLILGVGATSAVLGVLYALMQHDLKRLLAFHSIENIGIILIGLGSALLLQAHGAGELAALALTASLFHSINHAVFKTLLFLGAGAVVHATGLRDLNHLGGLGRKMPVTMLAFIVGAAAISGLPPLNGFASEWLTFQGLLGLVTSSVAGGAAAGAGSAPGAIGLGVTAAPLIGIAAALTIGALALTAALAVACFVKATGVTFLGLPRTAAAAGAHEPSRASLLAMALLALGCVLLGVAAGPITGALMDVARASLHLPAPASVAGASAAGAASIAAIATAPRESGAATYAPLALAGIAIALVALAGVAMAWRRARARRVDTWTCGIAPMPAFQYTATSYSKPIRLFFRRILAPEREVTVEHYPGTSFPEVDQVSQRDHAAPRGSALPTRPRVEPAARQRGAEAPGRGHPALHRLQRGGGPRAAAPRPMSANQVATTAILAALQLAVFAAFAPFLAASIKWTKARLQSRRGPGLLQPYRDLAKWWAKKPLESNPSGPVSRYAPAFVLGGDPDRHAAGSLRRVARAAPRLG